MSQSNRPSQANETETTYEVDKLAFETHPDRGYVGKAFYLKNGQGNALIQIFKEKNLLRQFLFPAYKIWNISAHFRDIVDGEIAESSRGYEMAAWDGIQGATFIIPDSPVPKDNKALSVSGQQKEKPWYDREDWEIPGNGGTNDHLFEDHEEE